MSTSSTFLLTLPDTCSAFCAVERHSRYHGVVTSELPFFLAFAGIKGVGPARLRKLIAHFGSLAAAWRAGPFDLARAGLDDKSVGVLEEDPVRNLIKIAKPMGVIGALSPSTNPEATPVIKAISAVKRAGK